ncbi:zinc ribbon domain-containing protein [Geodermatophilus sp. SYSU D01176]
MAVYVYRCTQHGLTEVTRAMGTAAATVPCPACDLPAIRVFTAPRLSLGSPARRALIDRTERTRDEPDVVSAPPPPPGGAAAAVARNPALRRLPRP